MATTMLTDVWEPETFASYQVEDPVMLTAFARSGVLTNSPLVDEVANGPGQIGTVPFWKAIDTSAEPNYSTDDPADIATPETVESGVQVVRNSDLNNGWSSADLVGPLAGSDPLRYVASVVDGYWGIQLAKRIIAITRGIYNANAGGTGDMVNNISVTTGTPATKNQISAGAVIDTAITMGDHMGAMTTIAMHSLVYVTLVKQDFITFVKDSTGTINIPQYLGMSVIVDDSMPLVDNGTGNPKGYLVAMYANGAIGYGTGTPKVPHEVARHAAQGMGGGVEDLWIRKRWCLHPFGWSWAGPMNASGQGNTFSPAPNLAALATAGNWTQVLQRKNLPIAFLVVNA